MKPFAIFLIFVLMLSCKDSKRPSYSKKKATTNSKEHIGKKLMETNCYLCHNPTASEENRIAPPMIAIKKRYSMGNTSKEAFINSIQDFIKNPIEDNAKMFGAVQRFGVMPKQGFPEETIKQIADYMYDFDIEKPDWFEDHYNEQHGNGRGNGNGKGRGNGMGMGNGKGKHNSNKTIDLEKLPYNERGLKYALSTKAVLGKNLMGTIQKKGTIAALKFCNEKAYPLTDSMAVYHKAIIKRVSDKPRNSNNKANLLEEGYIKIFKEGIKLNKEPESIVVESSENVKFYYPIKTNSMCLQCHGKPSTDIKANTLAQIDKLYPKDLAKGYGENQVRGIWSITFNK